ncbi:MAG: hypothetical protein NVS9B1_27230 [Candidatus Dormibacteraceae bacterium]
MTDFVIVALVIGYAGLGFMTGLVRRVIGLLALYIGFLAATTVDPTAASVLLQIEPSWTIPDALIAGFFLVLFIVAGVVEIFAAFYHRHLQLAPVIWDRPSAVGFGLLTGLFAATVISGLLLGAGQPEQSSPDGAQIQIHDSIRKSPLATVLIAGLGPAAKLIFAPVIPDRPGVFFEGQEARVQH